MPLVGFGFQPLIVFGAEGRKLVFLDGVSGQGQEMLVETQVVQGGEASTQGFVAPN